jgi:dolichol kinase
MEMETAQVSVGGQEISRKLIHLAGSVAATLIILVGPPRQARGILLGAAATAVLIELIRTLSPRGNRLFNQAFGTMLRTREWRGITGATTLAIGFVAAAFTVPPPLAAGAILMAGTGDAAGALVGRRFGRRRIWGGKSIEGSAACFIAAGAAALLIPGITPGMALAGAVVTTAIELTIISFDDNLILPLAAALTLRALSGVL